MSARDPRPFLVWCEEDGEEDPATILAFDEEEAAEKWAEAEDYTSADYSICGGRDEPVVCVRLDSDGADVHRFKVSGECVPQYYAHAIARAEAT